MDNQPVAPTLRTAEQLVALRKGTEAIANTIIGQVKHFEAWEGDTGPMFNGEFKNPALGNPYKTGGKTIVDLARWALDKLENSGIFIRCEFAHKGITQVATLISVSKNNRLVFGSRERISPTNIKTSVDVVGNQKAVGSETNPLEEA